VRSIRMGKLQRAHEGLLLMLRLWGIVTAAVEDSMARHADGAVPRVSSFALIPQPLSVDRDEDLKPLSRKLIERLPMPAPLPVWHQGTHGVLRRLMDIAFGSFGFAWEVAGAAPPRARQAVATAVAVAVAPALALAPGTASSLAAQARARMTVEVCRAGCWLAADNAVVQWVMRTMMIPRAVRWQVTEVVSGSRVHLFSRKPPRKGEARPVIFYVHGGGFVANLMSMDMGVIGRLANLRSNPIVVATEYPLAPEHMYPAALNVCSNVHEWIHRRFEVSKTVFVGESAGGNLALAVLLRLLDSGAQLPEGVVCAYPTLHIVPSTSPSRVCNNSDPLLATGIMRMVVDAYVPPLEDASADPFISPAVAPESMLRKLPPIWLQAGGLDPLLDDTIDFASRLRACEVPLDLQVYRGLPHGFWSLDALMPEAAAAVSRAVASVGKLLE